MAGVPQRIRIALAALAACLVVATMPATAGADLKLAAARLFQLGEHVHAESVAFAPDGRLWFGGLSYWDGTPVVGLLSARGKVSETSFPNFDGSVRSIVAGPDGAMWFAMALVRGPGFIGRADATGRVKRFWLPRGEPDQIVAGPDGALWFTEPSDARVGRITTSGQLTEFDLGPGSEPFGIAAGPDGAVWVTDGAGSRIVRLTASGEQQAYPVDPRFAPYRIAAGTDGLWFTERPVDYEGPPADRIGRIALDGTVTQVPVPASVGTGAIAVGPDGRVWFTTGPLDGTIESISASGEVGARTCLVRTCSRSVSSLAFGPDGRLWFGAAEKCLRCGGVSSQMVSQQSGFVGYLRRP